MFLAELTSCVCLTFSCTLHFNEEHLWIVLHLASNHIAWYVSVIRTLPEIQQWCWNTENRQQNDMSPKHSQRLWSHADGRCSDNLSVSPSFLISPVRLTVLKPTCCSRYRPTQNSTQSPTIDTSETPTHPKRPLCLGPHAQISRSSIPPEAGSVTWVAEPTWAMNSPAQLYKSN